MVKDLTIVTAVLDAAAERGTGAIAFRLES